MTETSDELEELLARRAAALAEPRALTALAHAQPTVVVTAGRERFALEAAAVREVFSARRATPLPWAPPHVAGLIARNGRVVPAFHLHAVLGLPLVSLPEHGRALVLGDGADALALLVEQVDVATDLARGDLQPLPPSTSAALRAVAVGVAPSGVVVLDVARLLASPSLVVDIALPRTS